MRKNKIEVISGNGVLDKGNKLANGYIMGFNIGLDDDDKNGPTRDGHAGNGSRSQDLEVQYFWANRARYNADAQNQADQFKASAANVAELTNTGRIQEVNLANTGFQNSEAQFNAGAKNTASLTASAVLHGSMRL